MTYNALHQKFAVAVCAKTVVPFLWSCLPESGAAGVSLCNQTIWVSSYVRSVEEGKSSKRTHRRDYTASICLTGSITNREGAVLRVPLGRQSMVDQV